MTYAQLSHSVSKAMSMLTQEISWRWPVRILAAAAIFTFGVWLIGFDYTVPQFQADPDHTGQIEPIDWQWWRQAADWLHGRKYIALTFDDGPSDHATDTTILQILAKHRAHAIFFTICDRSESPQQIADLRADLASGNAIGDHTLTHKHLLKISWAEDVKQVCGCQKHLEELIGRPVRWFRPPYGETSYAIQALAHANGMEELLWGDNSLDTWLRNEKQIDYWTVTTASNYTVVLMHSLPTTAVALDRTLTDLERLGYRFVLPKPHGKI